MGFSTNAPMGDPEFSDNTDSRYFDIGSMRIMWGGVAPFNDTTTVFLPAHFDINAPYSVNVTIDSASNNIIPSVLGKDRDRFTIGTVRGDFNQFSYSYGSVGWIAIGKKAP